MIDEVSTMVLSVVESLIDRGGRRIGIDRRNSVNGHVKQDRRSGSDRREGKDRRDFRHLNIRSANERRGLFNGSGI